MMDLFADPPDMRTEKHRYQVRLAFLIVGFSVLRIVVAALTSLGNDEVYYFTYAVQPDWNHFDHPPLVGIFIRIFTLNLRWNHEVALRLPAIFGAVINSILIARCARKLANRRAGLIAAVFYNTCIYTSIIAGTFIIPDSVQLTFWLLALQAALNLVKTSARSNKNLLLFGLWTGLAIMSKVHGIFLWAGLLAFIFLRKRSLLKSPALFLALGLTLIISSPIVFWNIDNDFISWQFHSERVEMNQGLQLKPFLVNVAGQILYFNPILFVLATLSLIGIRKQWHSMKSDQLKLLLWLSCPIILATVTVSLFRPTLPHWSGPGYLGIILLSAMYMSQLSIKREKLFNKLMKAAAILTLFVFTAGTLLVTRFSGTLSEQPGPQTGRDDATLDMYRWQDLRGGFEILRNQDIASQNISANAPLVVHKWFPGAHMFYYVAYPMKLPVRALGNMLDLHKFVWMNTMSDPYPAGSDAYYITPSNNFTDPALLFRDQFERIEKSGTITQKRGGKIARRWYVFRLKNAAGSF